MKKFVVVFASLLMFFSCTKKDDTPPRTSATTNTTTGSAPTTTVGPPATFSALCSNQKVMLIINGFTNPSYTVQNTAVFSNSVFTNFNVPNTGLNAGTVNLNGKIFKNSANFYNDTTNTYQTGPMNWITSGSVVPTFTYVNNNPYPTYADYTSWPDTIQKSLGFKVYMKSIFNADEAELTIVSSGNNNPSTYTAMVAMGSINVSTVSLLALSTATTAVIQCSFYKNNVQSVAGTQINFRNVTTFVKNVVVKN
jgi:hypothetical protein